MVNSNLAYSLDTTGASEVVIKDSPLKWCSVSLSDVISHGKRLEASVFDVEAKQVRETIRLGKYGTVHLYGDDGIIKTAYYPGWMQRSRLKRIYCDKQYGEGFYLPSQMTDVYPIADKYISRLANCNMDELRLKKDTLLLTRSGTIGSVSYVSRTLDRKVFSDDVIRISFKKEYDLGYVYTFLKSKVGNLILRTNGYGSVITHIEPDHLAEIQIPNAPIEIRKHINELIAQSYALRDESNEMIDEATKLIVQELQLPPIYEMEESTSNINAFSVKLSKLALRLDASNHVPIVEKIIKHISNHAEKVTNIGDPLISKAIILPGRFKRVYVDEGYGIPFFGGRSIGELDPSDKKFLSFSQHDKKIKEELTIREGMILVTCSGTVGNITLVPKHWDKWAMTHDIIRLVTEADVTGYVYIWLKTDYAARIINSFSYGSVVTHIEKDHLANVAIPLLKNHEIQKRINDLALIANQKRYEAYQLEQEALRIMDTEVIYTR